MKLHGHYRSSSSYRLRIALNLKGLAYEHVHVPIREGEHRLPQFRGLNPQGLIPLLEDDDGTILSQSLAIIEYLEERYPQPPLLPEAPLDRARVRSLALAVACDMHPLNNLRVLEFLRDSLALDDRSVRGKWYPHWISEGFRGLEEEARRYSADGRHLYGAAITLADVCLVPQMYNAERFDCDLSPYPTLCVISAHLKQLPEFARAAPAMFEPPAAP